MNFLAVLAVVSAVASIVGLFLPAQGWKQRWVHAIYGLAIAGLAGTVIQYQTRLGRIQSAERAASELVKREPMMTDKGFNFAALAFLEKNRDLFPDSYSRAQEICLKNNCMGRKHGDPDEDSLHHAWNQIDVSSALKGLLEGIAVIEQDT
ncbi:hypothetical protein [Thermomonas fusca]